MSTADEVLSKQQRAVKMALALQEKTDPQELLDGAAKLLEVTSDLQKAAGRLEAEFSGLSGPEERVTLTSDQRERIAESTGVAMDTLVVQDRDGAFARRMPTTDRATIERMAARQAAAIATRKARDEAVDKMIKRLEKLDVPELAPVIESLRKDPTGAAMARQQAEVAEDAKQRAGGQQP